VDLQEAREGYMTILTDEGFRPEIDSDGDIHFKFEGGHHYIIVSNCDDNFVEITFPGFWSIDDKEELSAALLAANNANRRTKASKVCVTSDGDRVSASVESYFANQSDVGGFLTRALRSLQLAVEIFRDELKKIQAG
jgi:putative sensory transduction regulator